MGTNFNKLLLRTAFSCMACDGEIAPEEVALIKTMSREKSLFGDVDIEVELRKMLGELNSKGKLFLKQYLNNIAELEMSKEQELSILQVAVDTILSDSKIEYSEIKFFKIIRSNMKVVSDAEILEGVRGIDESFIEKDINVSYISLENSYFNNIEFTTLNL